MERSNKNGYLKRQSTHDESVNRILIGVTGGSASGKTTLCQNIQKLMSFDANFNVLLIALDSFYIPIDKTKVNAQDYNFDHPSALDFNLAYDVLKALLKGEDVNIPQYCFVEHKRKSQVDHVAPTEVIIFQGILALYDRRIRDLMKYKIFINCDDDVRLCRRLKRDNQQRGRQIEGILYQYHRFVKDAYTTYIAPTMKYADLVVPGFRNNKTSVSFIVEHLKTLTRQMQLFKSALTTRIYFFGQIIDILLHEQISQELQFLDIEDQMQFIFPLSQQLTKELDLFMSQLINDRFNHLYFKSTFVRQFMRILGIQYSKLIDVRRYSINSIQLFQTHDAKSFEELQYDLSKSVFAIFLPILTKQIYIELVPFLEKKPKDSKIIILNVWCDHKHLMKLKTQKRCSLINLICLCQENKFIDILQSNVREVMSPKDIFYDQKLIQKSLSVLKQVMCHFGECDYY